MEKYRLDQRILDLGLVDTRSKAQGEIMAGNILVNNEKVFKSGTKVTETDKIRILKKDFPYVSRGALKLLKALDDFQIDVTDLRALDIGSSTGGFTEILLLKGASKVFAVDVGSNQLDYKLRTDPRVVSMEKTNARYITLDNFQGEPLDIIVTDVAFISLTKILEPAYDVLKDGSMMIALVKPQFEAGKDLVSKKGIVKDKDTHKLVINNIISYALSINFSVLNLAYSPIKGPKGNVEFLILLKKDTKITPYSNVTVDKVNEVVYESEF